MTGPATVHLGGRLRDAANPDDNVQPDQCLVCGTVDPNVLHLTSLERLDLIRAGLPCVAPILCLNHFEAAMRSLGEPTPTNVNTCIRCRSFAVTAVWPLQNTYSHIPIWRACCPCLAAAIANLVNRPQETPA